MNGTMEGLYPNWFANVAYGLIRWLGSVLGQDWSNVFLPEWLLLIVWAVILFTMIAIVAQAAVIFMVLMERKVLAWMTQRLGPNRVGPWGLLQTLADGVKLLFKEDVMTSKQDKLLFTLAPAVFFLPAFVFYALIPFTDELVGVALPAGALFVFAISSISVIGLVLAGWASNNKYSLLGGMRSAAQAISYELPLILSVLAVVLYTGTMNLKEIVIAQQGYLFGFIPNWFLITLTPVTFVIFYIASIAEVNRIPFDLPEAESELVSGYNTEYSGMKFALFFLAEYAVLFAMSAFTVVFFLGGWLSPFPAYLADVLGGANSLGTAYSLLLQVEKLFWFLMKTYVFIFVAMWWRATLPRLKPDQLMGFCWKFLMPLALINVFVITMARYWQMTQPDLWGLWMVVLAVLAFGGFFWLASTIQNKKLEARLMRE
jgi:NADH-quinone oxidoreductase subunit H